MAIDYSAPRRNQVDKPKRRFQPNCSAQNCPLAGAMSISTTGSTFWLCKHHFREKDTKEWGRITHGIRKHLDVIRLQENYLAGGYLDIYDHHERWRKRFAQLGVVLEEKNKRPDNAGHIANYIEYRLRVPLLHEVDG